MNEKAIKNADEKATPKTKPAKTNRSGKEPRQALTELEATLRELQRRFKKNWRTISGEAAKTRLAATPLDEETTQQLEKRIPELAKTATARAFQRALNLGNRILIAEAGELKEVSRHRITLGNGGTRTIKKIEQPIKMRKGQIIKIK